MTLAVTPNSIAESGAGNVSTVTATLDHRSSAATTVTVGATAGTAAVAGDFRLSTATTLTIAAGSTTSTGTVTGAGTITDDDAAAPRPNDEEPPTVPTDSVPSFGARTVEDRVWKQGREIVAFTLPAATGGNPPVRHDLQPDLPAGVTRTAFQVSGTPTVPVETTTYTWTATDADGDPVRLTFTLAVAEDRKPTLTETVPALRYRVGTTIEPLTLPAATGGDAPLTYTLTPPPPPGLTFDAAMRRLSGTPTEPADEGRCTLTAMDTDGNAAAPTFTLSVAAQAVVSIAGASAVEGGALAFPVTLSAAAPADVTLTWTTEPGTAQPATDYMPAPACSLTIPAGETAGTVMVPTTDDDVAEPEETFTVRLAAAGLPARAAAWTLRKPVSFRRISTMEMLSQSAFTAPLSKPDAPGWTSGWTLWGRGTAGGFDGEPKDGFSMDGEVFTGYVGLDYRLQQNVLLGLAVAHSRGDVDYETVDATRGDVDLRLTSVLPYAHWTPKPGLGVWGLSGAGWGDATIEDEHGRVRTDLEMRMAAVGARQEVLTWRQIDLAAKADAFLTELRTDTAEGLPKTAGAAQRVRLALEGRTARALSDVSDATPSLEIGGRWDDGKAETGFGAELGGGLEYTHRTLGLGIERGRAICWRTSNRRSTSGARA